MNLLLEVAMGVLLVISLVLWGQVRVLGKRFLERLKTSHLDAFERIPKPMPGMVRYGPLTTAQMNYVDRRGYGTLDDGELASLGDRLRRLQRAYIGSFAFLVLAIALKAVFR